MRLVVVEDEPIAREGLCALLAADPAVEVVGAFASADAARRGIQAARPDAMFVDVAMPGEGGVDLVRSIPAAARPHVVFVTAHEQYATDAFDVEAIDYVLKPIEEMRLAQAVARVRRALETDARLGASADRAALSGDPRGEGDRYLERLAARVGDRLVVIKLADVSWIAADGDYMRVHASGRTVLVRTTLRDLGRRLDPTRFIRVHRSAVVNIDFVVSVDVLSHGEYVATLSDGGRVRVGRAYRPALFAALGEHP